MGRARKNMKNKKIDTQEDINEIEEVDLMDLLDDLNDNVKLSFQPEESGPVVVQPSTPILANDDIRWKVEGLRLQGFDDNRIAAMLMIHKHIVEGIK